LGIKAIQTALQLHSNERMGRRAWYAFAYDPVVCQHHGIGATDSSESVPSMQEPESQDEGSL